MYDFYLSKKENNYYKKGENAMFTTGFKKKEWNNLDCFTTTGVIYTYDQIVS